MKNTEAALEAVDEDAAALLQTIQERPLTKHELFKAVQVLGAAGRLEKRAQREAVERERREAVEARRQEKYQEWLTRQLKLEAEVFPQLEEAAAAVKAGEFRTLKALQQRFKWSPGKTFWFVDAAIRRALLTRVEFWRHFPKTKRGKEQVCSTQKPPGSAPSLN